MLRSKLHEALQGLIWTFTGLMIFGSCYMGASFVDLGLEFNKQTGGDYEISIMFWGVFIILFGICSALVFAGLSFQLMDIRRFTKHTALNLKSNC
ncbi:MAG: hypothetical protein AAFQ32_00700 [Pseudomonadota bacterium]